MNNLLSVVLPTYNRCGILDEMLAALSAQKLPDGWSFETLVVDDGSPDDTAGILKKHASNARLRLRCKSLSENSGPAVARNEALNMAEGDLVLITGDDMIPTQGLLSGHIGWHLSHAADTDVLLGRVTWDPASQPSPFMQWLEDGGRAFYFNFKDLEPGAPLGPHAFYTSNISLKRKFLKDVKLCDPDFRYASHEDLELGFRLGEKGMHLFYQPELVVYHKHPLGFANMFRRVYVMGYSAAVYWEKAPDTAKGIRKVARELFADVCSLAPVRKILASAAGGGRYDKGSHPVMWKTLMLMSYSAGLADKRKGLPRQF